MNLQRDLALHHELISDIFPNISAQKAWEQLGELGHKLKSSARTVGANHLADICQGLETTCKSGDQDEAVRLYESLGPVFAQTTDRIGETLTRQ